MLLCCLFGVIKEGDDRAVNTVTDTLADARTCFLHIMLCTNATRFNFKLLLRIY